MRSVVSSTTTTFTWDLAQRVPQLLSDGSDHVWGPSGLVAAVTSAGCVTYAQADALGSVQQTSGTSGTPATRGYEAFGTPLTGGGSDPCTPLRIGYTGEQRDGETGLVYLRARYLDPSTGRFLSKDPRPGVLGSPASQHGYTYAHNNPVRWADPTGEQCFATPLDGGGWCDGVGGASLAGSSGSVVVITAAGVAVGVAAVIIPPKIQDQMGPRGWTVDDIENTVQNGVRVPTHNHLNPNNPASGYVNPDGSYVIVDDVTGEVIQVSDRNRPWKAPWDDPSHPAYPGPYPKPPNGSPPSSGSGTNYVSGEPPPATVGDSGPPPGGGYSGAPQGSFYGYWNDPYEGWDDDPYTGWDQ